MKSKVFNFLLIVALLLTVSSCAIPQGLAEDTALSYQLINISDGTFSYTLNVVVPASLVEYYSKLSHISASSGDFQKFVTPYTVKPIADQLRTIYPGDEDFANQVLKIVHQIPYEVVTPAYYPAEILVRNNGDCDLFSVLATSIMKAGGLDVVLLHYPTEEHMNIGVHLDESPRNARLPIFSVRDRNGVTYYVAESTSTNWQEGWRVGECPDGLKDAQVEIIPVPGNDIIAPGQVSASFRKLDPTSISLDVSPAFTTEGSTITVSGQISPAMPNQNVTIYYSANGSPWKIHGYSMTQSDGSFSYSWKSADTGSLDVRASWLGNMQYAGTTSNAKNSLILPFYLIGLIALATLAVSICVAVFIRTCKNRQKQPPTAPEMPQTINPTTPTQTDETNNSTL
jgi:hypothetical protein